MNLDDLRAAGKELREAAVDYFGTRPNEYSSEVKFTDHRRRYLKANDAWHPLVRQLSWPVRRALYRHFIDLNEGLHDRSKR